MDGVQPRQTSEDHDRVWKALADPTRRALLDQLRDGRKTTGQLANAIPGMSRYGVMKHLGILEEAGLVVTRKEGRRKWNHLNAVPLRIIYERWVSKYEDQWAGPTIKRHEHHRKNPTDRNPAPISVGSGQAARVVEDA